MIRFYWQIPYNLEWPVLNYTRLLLYRILNCYSKSFFIMISHVIIIILLLLLLLLLLL